MYMNTVMLFFCSTETIIVREYFMGAAMVCAKLWDMYSVVISRQSYKTISKFSRPTVMNSRVSGQCSHAIQIQPFSKL